jgi:DNA processing protein
MNSRRITNKDAEYPILLKEITHPPQRLWLTGAMLDPTKKYLTVVGTRNPTNYGIRIVQNIVQEVAAAGVVIVSGMALGIDGLAHKAALDAGGTTIAILAGGLDKIYPATNHHLAKRILANGGTLITEYDPGMDNFKQNFVARNRIQSGVSEAVLIVECAEKSGTLITAQFALEQNRAVMAIPGNIDNLMSAGPNGLIKQGAIPVTCAKDILETLGINLKASRVQQYKPANKVEEAILKALHHGIHSAEEIQTQAGLEVVEFTTTLTMLEIKGILKQTNPGLWDIA